MSNKLSECFNENRQNQIKKKLEKAKEPQEIVDILYDELSFNSDIDGEYINKLTPNQTKKALAILSLLRDSNKLVGKTIHGRSNSALKGRNSGGICSFFSDICNKFSKQSIQSDSNEPLTNESGFKLQQSDIDGLISELSKLFNRIDKLVLADDQVTKTVEKTEPQLSDFPDIIGFIQQLLGETEQELPDNMDFALNEELPSLFQRYGLKIHRFPHKLTESDLSSEVYDMYEIRKSRRVETIKVVYPAVLKESSVFLQGKLVVPA